MLQEEIPDLPLRRDPEALRLVGGLRSVNVLSVDWVFAGERLRGVFQLAEPLEAWVERLGDRGLRIRFAAGRLADFDWETLPAGAPLDSLRIGDEEDGARLDLYFRQAPGEVRSVADAMARTWAFTADLPQRPGLPEPEFERELAERLPGPALGQRRISRIVLDPGHGGADTGAVVGNQTEKDWNLKLAGWLEPHLEKEGFRVLWTRREDRAYRPSERAQAANVSKADLFLSLHFTRRGMDREQGARARGAGHRARPARDENADALELGAGEAR